MTNQYQHANILVCSSDDDAYRLMEHALSALSQHGIKRISTEDLFEGFTKIAAEEFDLLILDVGAGEVLDTIQMSAVRQHFHRIPVIFVSEKLSDDRMRRLFLLDGSDWLRKPLEARSFVNSVDAHIQGTTSDGSQVHAVITTSGGAGGTSVAVSLAGYLSKQKKRIQPKIALIDLDFAVADCGRYLNMPNPYDFTDVIDNPSRIDVEFIDIIRKRHETNFSFFSFYKPKLLLSPRLDELVLRMLDIISFQNEHTILDVPYYETLWRDKVISVVDSIVLVVNSSLPDLQKAKEVKRRIDALRGGKDSTTIVVNKVERNIFSSSKISEKQIQKIFDDPNIVIVPEDRSTMAQSINQGILPDQVNSRSSFCQAIRTLADNLRKVS